MANRLNNRAHMTSVLAHPEVSGTTWTGTGQAWGGAFGWFWVVLGGLGGFGGDMSSPPSLTRSL